MSDVKVNLETQEGVLVIREGEASKINEPVSIKRIGVIEAPADWFVSRKDHGLFDAKKAHVEVDKEKNTLVFFEDATNALAAIISGQVKYGADILRFGFFGFPEPNSKPIKFSPVELRNLIKLSQRFFDSPEEYTTWIGKLQSFQGKVSNIINETNNEKGKRHESLEQNAKVELPDSFKLNIPIFKNGEPVKFKVELRYQATDGAIELWLESGELIGLQSQAKDAVFDAQIKRFGTVTVINL